jgi:hypothetical protein
MSEILQLTIRADEASPEELAEITRELDEWINDTAPEVRSALPPADRPREGEKGVDIALGTLLLAFVNAGAATALVNCLSTYIKERRRSVKLEVRDTAGKTLNFAAENLGRGEIEGLVRQLDSFAGGTEARAS